MRNQDEVWINMRSRFVVKAFFLLVLCILFPCVSCREGEREEFVRIDAAQELDRLQKENETLIRENELMKNQNITESRLSGKIEYFYTRKDYEMAKSYLNVFMDFFPESPKVPVYRSYYENIRNVEAAAQERKFLDMQNLQVDNTGIWTVENFTDQNGNPTNRKFITTREMLSGTYSDVSFDAATFVADFIIVSKSNIALKIFERGNKEPVSGNAKTPIRYTIKATGADGKYFSFTARNTSDRIAFGNTASAKIHDMLIQGGTVSFTLTTTRDGCNVVYTFSIPNAQCYNTAFRLLNAK